MFRYRLNLPEQACHLRYGVPMAEALTIGMETNHMYLVSGNQILAVAVPALNESSLSTEQESPINRIDSMAVASFDYPIQSICNYVSSTEKTELICGIDERGTIKVFSSQEDGTLSLMYEKKHISSAKQPLEESWGLVRFSPSGKRLLSLHGLSSSINVFVVNEMQREDYEPIVIPMADHPRSACWRDEDTIVVTEHLQLSQFYIGAGGEVNAFNRVNVGTNDITCVCSFQSNDNIVACTATDRGVFGLNSRNLKIVKRWRAPIRNTVVGSVSGRMHCSALKMDVDVVFMCGDDNEVLMYNYSAREEKEGALKERHTINVRSRSRIIGLTVFSIGNVPHLAVLGQNGDLDLIRNPCDFMMERRKRKVTGGVEMDEKRMMMDE